ncbi:putative CRM domain-containing protein, chloroplastic [Trifolium repens]|nr:putative CRM domain-containing protein, chloroplastic [Trifolium repens]
MFSSSDPETEETFTYFHVVSIFAAGFWTFMFSAASVRGARHRCSCTFNRHSLFWPCLVEDVPTVASSPTTCIQSFTPSRTYRTPRHISRVPPVCSPSAFVLQQRSDIIGSHGNQGNKLPSRYTNNESVELKTQHDVVRFSLYKPGDIIGSIKNSQNKKTVKKSKKAKLNELRYYRLKAKQKMYSPNPEVRIRYKLGKAKRKETWLIEKLRKFDVPKLPPETLDPEILTEEERHYLKRTGEKKKHYVPVGRRGVFGGVVLNMHLHWKNHETVKVICKPCKPGQAQEYAEELSRLSKGIVIDIKPNNIIIFYRGKNYVQPKVMSPPDTLSKAKALEKYRYEQSLEHTSQFIERLEKELEEYHEHVAKFKKGKEDTNKDVRV